MWTHFALFLLAGTTLVNSSLWKEGYTYHYLLQTRAMTGVNMASQQFSGVLTKGDLLLHVTERDTLLVEIRNKKYASFHTELGSPWYDRLLESKANFVNMPLSQKLYKVTFTGGKILEFLADPEVPIWQVNIVKGILSQLQYIESTENRLNLDLPTEKYLTYTVREQSVGGDCDITYDLMPLTEDKRSETNMVPIPDLADDTEYIDILKNKDFGKCKQLPIYQFAVTNEKTNRLDKLVTRTAKTNMIVSCDKTNYCTIRSSIMMNTVNVRPESKDLMATDVLSMLNLTLVRMTRMEQKPVATDVKSAGNLTYTYNDLTLDTLTRPTLHDLESDSRFRESGELNSYESNQRQSSEELNRREYGYLVRRTELHRGTPTLRHLGGLRLDTPIGADLLQRATLLINEIATEIMTNDIQKQHTLEKFTFLTTILRYLDEKELTNLGDALLPLGSGYKKDEKKAITWKVYRDGLTQAGTGAAFLTVSSLITSKKVKDLEAAQIIARIPKIVREPTVEYIDALYEFIRNPDVKNQMFLNTTAPYAFSELVRYVMVGDHKHLYPTRIYGKLITTADKKRVTDTYIPYLSNELKKAYEAKDSTQIQTYITVLGNIAHPDIIRVFEPYLEGKYNTTTFQRMKMVIMLKTLTELKPYLVRPIVYKIFQNENENYRVRIAAIEVLLASFPSLRILQRMAERTNYETSPNVNSAIKSGLRSLANTQLPQFSELARNARIAEKSLNRNINVVTGQAYNFGQNYVSKEKDLLTWLVYNALDGKSSIVPDVLKLQLGVNFSSISPPDVLMGYSTTDLSALFRMIKNMFIPTVESGSIAVDDVTSKLNIKFDKEGLLEGCLVLRTPYGVHFLAFDHHTLQNVLQEALKYQKRKVDERPNLNMNSLVNWELTLIHPSELGMLVTYHLKTPMLVSFKNKVHIKGEMNPIDMKVSADLDTLLSGKIMSRIGFTAPFENRHYLSGVDINTQVHGAGRYNLELNWTKKKINFEYEPLPGLTRTTVFHHSIIPFTGNTDSLYSTPIYNDQNTQKVYVGKLQTKTTNFGKITIKRETDNFVTRKSEAVTNGNLYQQLMNYLVTMNYHYKKIDVAMDYGPQEDYKLSISLGYNKTLPTNNAQERPELLNTIMKETGYTFKKSDDVPATMHKVEAHVKMAGNNIHYKCEGGVIELEPFMYGRLYGQCHTRGSDVSTICAIGELYNTLSGCPTLDVTSKKEDGINLLVRYGKSCRDGKDVHIDLRAVQSPEITETITNLEEYRKAKEEEKEGNLGMTNTQKVCKFIDIRDDITLTAKMDPKELDKIYYNVINTFGDNVISDWKIDLTGPPQEYSWSKTGVINMKIKKLLPEETLNLTIFTPAVTVNTIMDDSKFPTLNLAKPRCTLGKTKVLTFDELEYPIKLKRYPYVLMISPTLEKYTQTYDLITKIEAIQDVRNIAILVEELKDGRRELTILNYAETFKILTATGSNGNTLFNLNGEAIDFGEDPTFLFENEDSTISVAKVMDKFYKITMKTAGINILYDGKRVQIEASNMYNGLLRGLCGNKDSVKKNDLIAPKGCVMKNPKLFPILYAYFSHRDVNDETKQELEEAKRAECVKNEYILGDVITDEERRIHPDSSFLYNTRHSCFLLKTDIVTKTEEICFSARPLLKCSHGCTAGHKTTKEIPYYCLPINAETLELKRRVELGANPDFSQRTISFYANVEVATDCRKT